MTKVIIIVFLGLISVVIWHEKEAIMTYISAEVSLQETVEIAVDEVVPTELAEKMASDDDFILLDVRTLKEHEVDHIKGSVLIPLDQLDDRYHELPKDKEIILYCRSGQRSNIAGGLLLQLGFQDVSSLVGGLRRWRIEQPKADGAPDAAESVPASE